MPLSSLLTTLATQLTTDEAARVVLRRHHVQVLGAGQAPLLFCSQSPATTVRVFGEMSGAKRP